MTTQHDTAQIVREYEILDGSSIHGVTFDGELVWFARNDEIVAFDPRAEKVVRRVPVPKAQGGTAFDGQHIYQLANPDILVIEPETGVVVRRIPAPGKGQDSGMAWADGYLYVGQYRDSKIHKISAKTGEVVKTLASDRFVTGVSCVGNELWHAAAGDGKAPELRRLGVDGEVTATIDVPVAMISGMDRTADGDFWCGGEKGKLRLVRRTKAA